METTEDYQRLAREVISFALEDLQYPLKPLKDKWAYIERKEAKESAIAFLLEPNEDLEFWCNLAKLNPLGIVRRAKELFSKDTTFTVTVADGWQQLQ